MIDSMSKKMTLPAFLPSIVLLTLLILTAGCSDRKPVRVTLDGTVTYKGSPLKSGMLGFHGEQGDHWTANINDGKFIVTDLAPGKLKVTYVEAPHNFGSSSDKAGSSGKSLPSSDAGLMKYSSLDQTTLEYTITEDQKKLEIQIP